RHRRRRRAGSRARQRHRPGRAVRASSRSSGASQPCECRAMTVRQLLQACARILSDEGLAVSRDASGLDVPCTGVTYDSRRAGRGSIFIGLRGQSVDGAAFAAQAIAAGAAAIVAERGPEVGIDTRVPWIVVSDARAALAELAAEFFGHPSRQMRTVGITGTNG